MKYLENGVKAHNEDIPDPWAKVHREISPQWYMQDIDAVTGSILFGMNNGKSLFVEYVPDNWNNRSSVIRDFMMVALFDRKTTAPRSFDVSTPVGEAFYLWMCREIGRGRKVKPRFFYVIGAKCPWDMVEVCIETGKHLQRWTIENDDKATWEHAWKTLGLYETRRMMAAELNELEKTA